jgi:hypothetical protein
LQFITQWLVCSVVIVCTIFVLARLGAWDRFEAALLDFAEAIDDDLDSVAAGNAPSTRFQIGAGITALILGFFVAVHL